MSFLYLNQAVEAFTCKTNHSVQKDNTVVDHLYGRENGDFDEHKELLADAVKEKDVVNVDYKTM